MAMYRQTTPGCSCCIEYLPSPWPRNPSFIVPCYSKELPLPEKVMTRIFEYYIELEPDLKVNTFIELCTLGKVCETWRQLIVRTDSLWEGIQLVLTPSLCCVELAEVPVDEYNGIYFDYDTMKILHKRGHVKIVDPQSRSFSYSDLKFVENFELTMHFFHIIAVPKLNRLRNILARLCLGVTILGPEACSVVRRSLTCPYNLNHNILSNITDLDMDIKIHRKYLGIKADDFVKLVPNLTRLVLSGYPEFKEIRSAEQNKVKSMPENYGFKKLEYLSLDKVSYNQCWSLAMLIGCSDKLRMLTLRGAKAIERISLEQFWKNKKLEQISMIHDDDLQGDVKLSPLVNICRQKLRIFTFEFRPTKSDDRDKRRSEYEIVRCKEERMRVLNSLYQEGRNTSLQQIHYNMRDMDPDEASLVSSLKELCRQNCNKIEKS